MEISMEDLFYGFVRNYHSFRLYYNPPWTNWTNKILGYFDHLGTSLGARVKYEWRKYDLTWFRKGSDEVWLHVEHENYTGWNDLDRTIVKINESKCENVIAIVYPADLDLVQKFLKKLEKSCKQWTEGSNVLVIVDFSDFQYQNLPIRLEGHLFSNVYETEIYHALKYEEKKTSMYYAVLV